jgi:hypothetical protein
MAHFPFKWRGIPLGFITSSWEYAVNRMRKKKGCACKK